MTDTTNDLKQILLSIFNITESDIENLIEYKELDEWDSLSRVRYLVAVEAEFNVSFDENDLWAFEKLSDTVQLISDKKGS